jgi:hypothetical protein
MDYRERAGTPSHRRQQVRGQWNKDPARHVEKKDIATHDELAWGSVGSRVWTNKSAREAGLTDTDTEGQREEGNGKD